MKISRVLVVYTKPKSNTEKSAFNIVKNTLKKNKVNYKFSHREKLSSKLFRNNDLVIAIGGDGTFLRASHIMFDKTPILGFNPDPVCKEGFFMTTNKNNFEKNFKKLLKGSYKIKKFRRLEARINKKKVPELALNEFYISSEKQYHTAVYFLRINGKKERQKSSGILISTSAGSNAWIKSAGGKILPLESNKFQYLVREPYYGRISAKCNLVRGTLNKNEKIEIIFDLGNGILIVDSLSKEYKFKTGEKVIVKMSNKPLYCISFQK